MNWVRKEVKRRTISDLVEGKYPRKISNKIKIADLIVPNSPREKQVRPQIRVYGVVISSHYRGVSSEVSYKVYVMQ
jgi:hypothetical protein